MCEKKHDNEARNEKTISRENLSSDIMIYGSVGKKNLYVSLKLILSSRVVTNLCYLVRDPDPTGIHLDPDSTIQAYEDINIELSNL